MSEDPLPDRPSLPWRIGSTLVIGATGFLTRTFLLGLSHLEVHGWEGFERILDERGDVSRRTRGLITVSNHISVMDDPIVWGALPFRYHWNPDNARWSLASHDIAFTNKHVAPHSNTVSSARLTACRFLSRFFELGNTLPTHRQMYSKYGGLFQPTMTQTIRLLSDCPYRFPRDHPLPHGPPHEPAPAPEVSDPFSAGSHSYTTTGTDVFRSPSGYLSRRHSWVHIFPEGRIHQHPEGTMRYFKWGVSRLILEAEPAPDVVPMYIEGLDQVMHESRGFPRFLPRIGKRVSITFGDKLDGEVVFGDLRARWAALKKRVGRTDAESPDRAPGLLMDEELRTGAEAVELREECTLRVRRAVLALQAARGFPDEDPKGSLAATWAEEDRVSEKPTGKMDDDSWVGGT